MIETIQNLIEDNTSMDITRNQTIMGLTVVVLVFLLIIIFLMRSGGSKEDVGSVQPAPIDHTQTYLP